MNDVESTIADLVAAAAGARRNAYAPYSHFAVGAAVLAESGLVYAGTNVENASSGLTICAERAAIFAAVSAGERRIKAVAVVTNARDVTPPCGACRQVLLEFGPDVRVVCDSGSDRISWSLAELLPHPFGPDSLRSEAIDWDASR